MTTPNHPLMTVADVAETLGVGERFVRRLVAERRMPYLKIGAKVRFAREDLEAFMAASRREVGETIDLEFLEDGPAGEPAIGAAAVNSGDGQGGAE